MDKKRSIGSVKNLGDGRYRLRISNAFDEYGKRIQICRTVRCSSDRAAEAELMKLYNEKNKISETRCLNAPVTLAELWDEFKANYASTLRPSTQDYYSVLWAAHIKEFGKSKLKSFSPKMVYGILSCCSNSPRTQKGVYGLLRTMFTQAVNWGYMGGNPCTKVKAPKYKAEERVIYDEAQLETVIKEVQKENLIHQAFSFFGILCGMRRGEIMGLRWTDLNLGSREIRITQAAGKTHKGTYYDDPKTKKSVRKLTLPETLVPILNALWIQQAEQKLRLGEKWADTPFVFKKWDGTPLGVDVPTRWWQRFRRAHPNLAGPNFHTLRHMAATYMIKNNVPISTVSGVLGHAQMATTMNIYGHVIEDAKEEALGTLESAVIGKKATSKSIG